MFAVIDCGTTMTRIYMTDGREVLASGRPSEGCNRALF